MGTAVAKKGFWEVIDLVPENDVFLMRSMWPSYRTSSHAHTLWVAVESNGNSLAGHCNCMAGEVNKPTDLWHHIA